MSFLMVEHSSRPSISGLSLIHISLGDPEVIGRCRKVALELADASLKEGINPMGCCKRDGDVSGRTDTRRQAYPCLLH